MPRSATLALAARWAADSDELTSVEEPDLIHVHPLLPLIPEAQRAWATTVAFLR